MREAQGSPFAPLRFPKRISVVPHHKQWCEGIAAPATIPELKDVDIADQ
jgi:hypothetical protein